jgi:hypothetical protein
MGESGRGPGRICRVADGRCAKDPGIIEITDSSPDS